MKKKIFSLVLLCTAFSIFAQQDAQFTQYMYNTVSINPAYAGSRGALSILALHRNQWIGTDGAPVTNTLSISTPFNESKLGLGISVVNDKIGPTDQTDISLDFSYTINTSETYKLSFGIKGTASLFNVDTSKLNPVDPTDEQFQNSVNEFSPNLGAGIYFHSDKGYLGFSIPNFVETNYYNDNEVAIFKEKINYYFIGGYVFDFGPSIKFKPTILTKIVEGSPLQADVSGNVMINDIFILGLAYRWSSAISALAGFQISNSFHIGYAYDFETTEFTNYNSGSHEIFLRYEIFKKNNKIITPRFF